MEFLVYTAELLDENTTFESFEPGVDQEISRMVNLLEDMDLDRVVDNQTVNLLVDNIEYDRDKEIVSADIYKQTNPGKALHQVIQDDGAISIQEIISENEDAFMQGLLGIKKVDNDVHILIEVDFGSFFVTACNGMEIKPQYSSETIRSIQESDAIGRTTLDFADDYDLTASLFKPPEDGDIREEEGLGKVDLANKIASLLHISQAHRMSLDIPRDEWLANIEIFDKLIESGIVTTVRVEDTINGIVKLGQGGERAIRKKIQTPDTGFRAVEDAFDKH